LIKTEVNYILEDDKGVVIASTSLKKEGLELSLKNCQAIENGYDLDDIVEQTKQTLEDSRISSYESFKIGFQKALELLGDKKFSEEDLKKIIHWSTLDKDVRLSEEELFKSLQQTEWDVEIEMEYHPTFHIQKLDADGCLILKRI
jgi:hypothetical protein